MYWFGGTRKIFPPLRAEISDCLNLIWKGSKYSQYSQCSTSHIFSGVVHKLRSAIKIFMLARNCQNSCRIVNIWN